MNGQTSLQDFERACQQTTDKTQREQIALQALNFLLQKQVPNDIGTKVKEEFDNENASSGGVPPLPESNGAMNDTLCAQLEARLAKFFPSIFFLKESADPAVALLLLARAEVMCQKIDAWREYEYWTPLFDFLRNATADQWQQWRSAMIAQRQARAEIGNGDFERAQWFAIYGLKNLLNISATPTNIRDYRLYLDLCSRLENAIAEGEEACLRLAAALGSWVAEQSLAIGHFLRAVGMLHNLGNQHLIAGKNNDALNALEYAQQLCNAYWPVQDISYYEVNLLERLARAYLNRGEAQKASDHLKRYEVQAQQPREKTLCHLGKGYWELYNNNLERAKSEFEAARQCALGQGSGNPPEDFFNLWSAYVSLGLVCEMLNQTDEALKYLNESRKHGGQKKFLNNPDRAIHDGLIDAEIAILQKNAMQAENAIQKAEKILADSLLDSPRRDVQLRLTRALLNDLQKKDTNAKRLRDGAFARAREDGFSTSNIDQLKALVFG